MEIEVDASHDPERWRPVPRFDGLIEASDKGRIRSLSRIVATGNGGRRTTQGKVLKPQALPKGYLLLTLSVAGKRGHSYVHQLVCEAFHGTPSAGQQVRHLNGICNDNRPDNLRWGTCSENALDRVRHGTYRNGSQSKTHCPSGHRLLAPNLIANKALQGRRCCRSCDNARSYVQTHPNADVAREADRYYQRYWPAFDAAA